MQEKIRTVGQWLATTFGAVGLLSQTLSQTRALFESYFAGYTELVSSIFGACLVLGIIALVANRPGSRHRAPEELPRAIACSGRDRLIGREAEIESLVDRCLRSRCVLLVGHPGVGKSAVLRFGLETALREEGSLLPVYVKTLSPDGAPGAEASQLAIAMWRSLSEAERDKLSLRNAISPDNVFDLLGVLHNVLRKRPLLIFDHVDDYLAGSADTSRPRASTFWSKIGSLVAQDRAQLVTVCTPQSQPAAESLVDAAHTVHLLPELRIGVVAQWLEDLDKVLAAIGRPVLEPEGGWSELKATMVRDLAPRDLCLPHQLVAAVHGLTGLDSLTPARYRNFGGALGLLAFYVRLEARETASRLDWEEQNVIVLLASMLDTLGGRASPRAIPELRQSIATTLGEPGLKHLAPNLQAQSDRTLEGCLDLLKNKFVRKGRRDEADVYELRHTYLAPALRFALLSLDDVRTNLIRAEAFHARAQGLRARWRTLLPLSAQVRLWWQRARGRVTFKEQAGYVLRSLFRWAVVPTTVVAYLALADAGVSLPAGRLTQDGLDRLGLTLARQPPSVSSVRARLSVARGLADDEILRRCRPGPGCVSRDGDDIPKDEPWLESQALAAGLSQGKAPIGADQAATLVDDLRALLTSRSAILSGGRLKGFTGGALTDCPIIEPTLWSTLATAEALQRPSAMTEEFRSRLRDLSEITESDYFLSEADDKKSDRGPALLESPEDHSSAPGSVYATSLAVIVYTELLTLAPDLGLGKRDEDLARWLEKVSVAAGVDSQGLLVSVSGWPAQNRPGEMISEGVTFQVLYALARASRAGLIKDSRWPALVVQWADRLVQREDIFSESSSLFIVHYDRDRTFGHHVRFMWYPWAVGVLLEWEDLAAPQASAKERLVVGRALAHLADLADANMTHLKDVPLFRLSEYVFVTRNLATASATAMGALSDRR